MDRTIIILECTRDLLHPTPPHSVPHHFPSYLFQPSQPCPAACGGFLQLSLLHSPSLVVFAHLLRLAPHLFSENSFIRNADQRLFQLRHKATSRRTYCVFVPIPHADRNFDNHGEPKKHLLVVVFMMVLFKRCFLQSTSNSASAVFVAYAIVWGAYIPLWCSMRNG